MDYKEKLRLAKEALDSGSYDKETIEYIFPELKESEDEGIRKTLIEFVKEYGDKFYGQIAKMSAIAWLEKQGLQKQRKEWDADDLWNYNQIMHILQDCNQTELMDWLEKQGGITKLSEEERNGIAKGVLSSCALSFINYLDAHKYKGKMCVSNGECEDIENAFHNAMWDRLHRYYCKYIKTQGEQKSNDKVKPKFKVGDYIINEYGFIMQVDGINNNKYTYHVLDDNKHQTCDIKQAEKSCHLWTIRDAKDGDVLTTDLVHFMFKSNDNDDVHMYCAYSVISDVFNLSDTAIVDSNYVHPATKEQKDLLFQKMKEEGYEWDIEKKELKKIEQKLSAWSEEDEKTLNTIIEKGDLKPSEIDWLKSLKE